jgi:hypothetical protein
MEAMYFPPGSQWKNKISADLLTGTSDVGTEGHYIGFCLSFKYLGSFMTPDLDDTFDIDA